MPWLRKAALESTPEKHLSHFGLEALQRPPPPLGALPPCESSCPAALTSLFALGHRRERSHLRGTGERDLPAFLGRLQRCFAVSGPQLPALRPRAAAFAPLHPGEGGGRGAHQRLPQSPLGRDHGEERGGFAVHCPSEFGRGWTRFLPRQRATEGALWWHLGNANSASLLLSCCPSLPGLQY